MKRASLRTVLTTAAAGLAAIAFTTPATAAQSDATVHQLAGTSGQARSAAEYWTADAMRSAVPMKQLLGSATKSAGQVARGAPQVVEPVLGATPKALPSAGDTWTGGGEVTKTAGRVFFTFNGKKASCSGNAVTSDNRSTVITAGHCVKYQGSWHKDWVFVPGYDHGDAPYGKWAAEQTMTTPQWEASEDINYDVGAAVVAPQGGKNLTDVVGGQGIAFNQERNQDMYAFGYPAADPYDGSELVYCSGSTIDDPFLSNDQGLSCDMTGGSSGGPWFLSFDESSGAGVQNSVNSFGYRFLPGYMFGPYFGSEAQTLYQQAQAA